MVAKFKQRVETKNGSNLGCSPGKADETADPRGIIMLSPGDSNGRLCRAVALYGRTTCIAVRSPLRAYHLRLTLSHDLITTNRLLQHRVRETRSPGCPETDETLFRYFGAAAGLELATTKAESSVLIHYTTGRTPVTSAFLC